MSLSTIKQLVIPTLQSNARYLRLASSSPVEDDIEQQVTTAARSEHNGISESEKLDTSATLDTQDAGGRCHRNESKLARVNPRIISDATIGLSDGLTVPFALTAGLSALGDARIVVYGGLAELIAGSISMGLGGYLGAKSEAEAYQAALAETKRVVYHDQDRAAEMVHEAFGDFALDSEMLETLIYSLRQNSERMVTFLMRFHHQLVETDFTPSKAYLSGLTISAGYFTGGLVPLLPYFFATRVQEALVISVMLMAIALFAFGWIKTSLVGESSRIACVKSAVQMVILGAIAAAAAMGCVKAVGGS